MNSGEQDKLDWIRERFNYLLEKKSQLEDFVKRWKGTKNVNPHKSQIQDMRIEMKNIDNERTVICLKSNERRFNQ